MKSRFCELCGIFVKSLVFLCGFEEHMFRMLPLCAIIIEVCSNTKNRIFAG